MSTTILATKLYRPPPRAKVVLRPCLLERLDEGLQRKLTLVSAPAGFGKTTLVSEWLVLCGQPAAWLSLDEGDNDPARFLAYLVAALRTLMPGVGEGVLSGLQSPQPPPIEALLTGLINDLSVLSSPALLVLDDCHVLDAEPLERALVFLLEYLPPSLHVLLISREDPPLPLARLRAQGDLTELRAADLRFNTAESAGFLEEVMGLTLSEEDVALLGARTEGWVVGLQLAALSLRGQEDVPGFIRAFSGSHRFVLDYLLEEVLERQPKGVQAFLLRSAILERFCAPLCDVLLPDAAPVAQETLLYLERANLFIVPLDDERRWFRYHHLFADLLRQRLRVTIEEGEVAAYHLRASEWLEANGWALEAFSHAVAAEDVARAARLLEGGGMPLIFRGAVTPALAWLASLPRAVRDARPSLWVIYASALLFAGRMGEVEGALEAAERALEGVTDEGARDLLGHVAAIRATLAVSQHQVETILEQSQRALTYLHPDNLPVRTATVWTLGYAYQLQGERAAAESAYREAIARAQTLGHFIITLMATTGLGNIEEGDTRLPEAAQTYGRVLELVGEVPPPAACEAYLGLARIHYEWNDLAAAEHYAQESLRLAQGLPHTDRGVAAEGFFARLKLAQGDLSGAATHLAHAARVARQHGFAHALLELAATEVRLLLRQGDVAAAATVAEAHDLPLSRARVRLARGDAAAALTLLAPWQQQVEARAWRDEQLKVRLLQARAHHAQGAQDAALQCLAAALTLAEAGGCIRSFLDEGAEMAQLLSVAAQQGTKTAYVAKLQAAFSTEMHLQPHPPATLEGLLEPLSERELEVLRLIAQGLSNHEISKRLFRALSTVKGHNQLIFEKLRVKNRTEAVARARALGLL